MKNKKNNGKELKKDEDSPQKEIMEKRKGSQAHPLSKDVKKKSKSQKEKHGTAGEHHASTLDKGKRNMSEHKMFDTSGQDTNE